MGGGNQVGSRGPLATRIRSAVNVEERGAIGVGERNVDGTMHGWHASTFGNEGTWVLIGWQAEKYMETEEQLGVNLDKADTRDAG